MLRKLLIGAFVFIKVIGVVGASSSSSDSYDSDSSSVTEDINYTKVCMQKASNPSEFGFVCLEARSQQYLQCYLPGNVALMMNCPSGTFCSSIEGEWTTSNPCGK